MYWQQFWSRSRIPLFLLLSLAIHGMLFLLLDGNVDTKDEQLLDQASFTISLVDVQEILPEPQSPPEPVEKQEEAENSENPEAIPQEAEEEKSTGETAPNQSETPAPQPALSYRSLVEGLNLPMPTYPETAQRWKQEGVVTVAIGIDKDGNVTSVRLHESSGHNLLDREVIRTIEEKWRFNPPGRDITLMREFGFTIQ